MERTQAQRDRETLAIAVESLARAVRKWAFYFDRMDSEELDELNAAFAIVDYLVQYQKDNLNAEREDLQAKLEVYNEAVL